MSPARTRPALFGASVSCARVPEAFCSCLPHTANESLMQSPELLCTQAHRPSNDSYLMPLREHRDLFCACKYRMRVPETPFSCMDDITAERASRSPHTSGFSYAHICDGLLMHILSCHSEKVKTVLSLSYLVTHIRDVLLT